MPLFEHLPTPAIHLDRNARIIRANSRAQSLFGWRATPPSEAVIFTRYLASDDIPAFARFYKHLTADRESVFSTTLYPEKNLRVPVTIKGTATDDGERIFLINRNDSYSSGCGGKCLYAVILEAEYQENPGGILLVNEKMEMVSFNNEFIKIWNIPPEILQARDEKACLEIMMHKLVDPDDFLSRVNELYKHPEQVSTDQLYLRDGRILYRHTHPIYSYGSYLGRFWYFLDITSLKAAHYQIEKQQIFQKAILENIQDGIVACDAEGTVNLFNRASRHLYSQSLRDQRPVNIFELEHYLPDDILTPIPPTETPLAKALAGNTLKNEEVVIIRKHTRHTLRVNGQAMYDSEGKKLGAVVSLHDITDLNRVKEQLHFMAYHDALTGLPNRRLFHDLLLHSLRHAHRNNEQVGVLVLDLDNFKAVNDSYGHDTGDRILQEVAYNLRQILRGSDLLCRWGGDEFVIALLESGLANGVEKVASKLCERVLDHVLSNDKECRLSVSVGIAMYPRHGTEPDLLIRNADMAMYRAKRLGRNRCEIFLPDDLPNRRKDDHGKK